MLACFLPTVRAFYYRFVSLLHTKAPYFIPAGALHKAVAVAALLRDVALPPPELYIFCMAPVSVSRCTQGHRNERHQEGGHSNMPESEDKAELPWQGAIDVDNSHSPEAAGTEGTGSDSAAAVTAAAASISLPMQAALRSFAVSLAATRVVPLPSPFRVVRKTDKEQQQHQRMQHLGLCSAEEGPWSSYTAAGVGYLGGTVDPASDGEETEATPAETIEALRAWETIYQVFARAGIAASATCLDLLGAVNSSEAGFCGCELQEQHAEYRGSCRGNACVCRS